MDTFIGIDVGTSACRACAIDAAGNEVANARVDLPPPARDGAAVEQDAAVWWDALTATLDHLCATFAAGSVRRIALDATSSTLLLCTRDGTPLTTALMYDDARATAQAQRIARAAPADSAAAGATSSLAKLLYLLERCPVTQPRAAHQGDWLNGMLCGTFGICDENNALKLGYDARRRRWPDWIDALGLPDGCLPAVRPPGTPLGEITPALCQRWGLAPGASLVCGTTDSTAGVIATGALNVGDAVTALGSTLVLKVVSQQPVTASLHGVYSHRLGDRWLAGGASNTGGGVLAQFFDATQLAALSAQVDPRHPICLDYYPLPGVGERFPVADPHKQPRIHPRPKSDVRFLQGLLQAIARIERHGYRLLAGLGAPYPTRVLTVGGGADNVQWTEIRRRLLGVPVSPAQHREAAYGAALLARGLQTEIQEPGSEHSFR